MWGDRLKDTSVKLRTHIFIFSFLFALVPLLAAVVINLPLVLERMELFYHKAHLQNLRADFRDLDQHLASREEMVRLLAKLPEPGSVIGDGASPTEAIDLARTRYAQWLNQIMQDQLDIIQIVFFDRDGVERFWLDRDIASGDWQPTTERPQPLPPELLRAAMNREPGPPRVSSISLDPQAGALDPRRYMTLRLISPIQGQTSTGNIGTAMIVIDVGGMARVYRNTLWVQDNGEFLRYPGEARGDSAFDQFQGLKELFASNVPALWSGDGQQIMWVPLFRTEQAGALWVGRHVDPSPIAEFRDTMTVRVLSIVFGLVIFVWFAARLFSNRADRLGKELTEGIQRTLETEQPVTFSWRGPQELRRLGDNLSRLSVEHSKNSRNLRAHARELEESNRYKSQFLANVSHELRTPLNSILLLSKLLADQRSGLNPDQAEKARVIHEAGSDLQALIDNILDLSRIEARKTTLDIEQVEVAPMLEELITLVHPQFEAKGLWLKLEIDPRAPHNIATDLCKVRQIIKNFLSNAVKFTRQGGVVITLQPIAPSPACDCELRIGVRDTGIGIPEEQQGHIFEAFRQGDGSTNRRYGGTGLGLAISQQLAHLLGGHIELNSEIGGGSTFSLLLPLAYRPHTSPPSPPHPPHSPAEEQPTPTPAPTRREPGFAGHRALILEDDVRLLLQLTPLLERWGLEVTAAGDGEEACEALEEEPFSILLATPRMLLPDGCDTIRAIRATRGHAALSVVVLTESADESEREGCLVAGVNDFVPRPIDPARLHLAIAHHLAPRET
ncbi:MAG: ATP-binding protein [Candidatus Sedimenticola endophacoides]